MNAERNAPMTRQFIETARSFWAAKQEAPFAGLLKNPGYLVGITTLLQC